MDSPVQGQIGVWTSPTGEQVPIVEPALNVSVTWNITAVLDGAILPVNVAYASLLVQRDYWRRKAEEARTALADARAEGT